MAPALAGDFEITEDVPPTYPTSGFGMGEPTEETGQPWGMMIIHDAHAPWTHPLVESIWNQIAADHKPREIHWLGDSIDFQSLSRHGDAHKANFKDEAEAGRRMFARMHKSAPDAAQFVYEGNHDAPRKVANHLPAQFEGMIDLVAELHLDAANAKWVPHQNQPVRRGKALLEHGDEAVPMGRPGKYHAEQATQKDCGPGDDLFIGHAHRMQTYVRAHRMGNMTCWAGGTGSTRTDYMRNAVTGWEFEFKWVWCRPSGTVDPVPLRVRNGAVTFNGRLYVGRRET